MLKGNKKLHRHPLCLTVTTENILINMRIKFENSKKNVTLDWHLTSLNHVVFTKWRGGD